VAFYASTPAYRSVLDIHGWGDLQTELQKLVKADRWSETGELIDNHVLSAFVTIGDAASVSAQLATRFGGMVDHVVLTSQTASVAEMTTLAERLRAA